MAVQQLVLFFLGVLFVILGGFLMFYESLRRTMRKGPTTLYKATGGVEEPKKDRLAQILDSFAGLVKVMDRYLGKTNQSSKAGLLLVVLGFAMILGSFYLK